MVLDALLCGTAFGAALTAAGVHQPVVIVSQLTMNNFHMVESFLAAAASSAILVTIFQRLGYINVQPRSFSSMGLFGSLDGNILGGLIQGIGMALSGSCPGTVFAQTGAGIKSGFFALSGTMIGGILWSGFIRSIVQHNRRTRDTKTTTALTVDKQLGISQIETLLVFEVLSIAMITAAALSSSSETRGLVHPVVGGLLIGATQLLSIVSRKTLLGTSTSFEEVGNYFWWLTKGGNAASKPESYKNIVFTTGLVLGAWAISSYSPSARAVLELDMNPTKTILGGMLLAVGSRMAGGCTSGHGISGVSLLSLSSFVTVAAMFAGGIGVARAL